MSTPAYEVVMGLEIHAQLATESKIFCGCPTGFGAEPNTNTCPVCLGYPGVLPVLNKKVVEFAAMAGLATNCTIARHSRFARKNYFYPDLAKGYQISQYEQPLCENGHITVQTAEGEKTIGITRIHIEEDPAKSLHEGGDYTALDFNRSGTALIEIVSEPDFRTVEEVTAYLSEIKLILEYLKISHANMEEGNLRVDANISLRPAGTEPFGTKTEIKNMNSFRNVGKALEYEIERQRKILSSGGTIDQDTYLWDPDGERTVIMRSKEYAHDYRYFPDPDLVPVTVDDAWLEKLKAGLPDLPQEIKKKFVDEYGLPEYNADVIANHIGLPEYFEKASGINGDHILTSTFIMGEWLKAMNERELTAGTFPVPAEDVGELLSLQKKGTISGKIAKTVFEEMLASGKKAGAIVEEKGLVQISDDDALEKMVEDVIAANPKEVDAYKAGKTKLIGFFVGQIMKESKGKANPGIINGLLKKKLEG